MFNEANTVEKLILLPNAQKVILENAGHACYMRATDDFHQHLVKFIESCHRSTGQDK